MGRMFQVLNHSRKPTPPVTLPHEPTEQRSPLNSAPSREIAGEADESAEIPFVEIGSARWLPPTPPRTSDRLPQTDRWASSSPAPAVSSSDSAAVSASTPVLTHYLSVTYRAVPAVQEVFDEDAFSAELLAYHHPDHEISGQYRVLRNEMLDQLPVGETPVMLFTSALPQAGTSTVLLNLAITLAREETLPVLVIDAHPVRPCLHERLSVASGPGWRDALAKTVPLAWTVHRTGMERLFAMPIGDVPRGAAVPKLEAMAELLARLRKQYGWILLDAGPWNWQPELSSIASLADATYLVVRQDDVDTAAVAEMHERIVSQGAKLRGYVLTSR